MFDVAIQVVMDKVDALREQVDDHWQIPREEALILAQLVRISGATSICEIGHSYGFSTLHLAAAAKENGGHVYSFDLSEKKHAAARRHLEEAGLANVVTLHLGDARELVAQVTPAQPYDFAFVDAVKVETEAYLKVLWPKLAGRAVVTADNTKTHPDEMGQMVRIIRGFDGVVGCDVPVGNGFELALKRG